MSITGSATNTPLDAIDDTITDVALQEATDGNALINDIKGPTATASIATQPQFGTASVGPDGRIVYQANQSFTTDSFQYTLTDPTTGQSDTATITVNAASGMDHVTANDDSADASAASILIDVLLNDVLPNQFASMVVTMSPTSGTAVVEGNRIRYIPTPGSQASDSFEYIVYDSMGHSDTAIVSVNGNTTGYDQVTANDDSVQNVASSTSIDVLQNDSLPNSFQSMQVTQQPTHGTATVEGNRIRYVPSSGYSGPDSFEYIVYDMMGHSDTAIVSINDEQEQQEQNDAPAIAANMASPKDGTIAVTQTLVLSEAYTTGYVIADLDSTDSNTKAPFDKASHVWSIVNGTGDFTINPTTGELKSAKNKIDTGVYSVEIKVTDGGNLSATKTIHVDVREFGQWTWKFSATGQVIAKAGDKDSLRALIRNNYNDQTLLQCAPQNKGLDDHLADGTEIDLTRFFPASLAAAFAHQQGLPYDGEIRTRVRDRDIFSPDGVPDVDPGKTIGESGVDLTTPRLSPEETNNSYGGMIGSAEFGAGNCYGFALAYLGIAPPSNIPIWNLAGVDTLDSTLSEISDSLSTGFAAGFTTSVHAAFGEFVYYGPAGGLVAYLTGSRAPENEGKFGDVVIHRNSDSKVIHAAIALGINDSGGQYVVEKHNRGNPYDVTTVEDQWPHSTKTYWRKTQ